MKRRTWEWVLVWRAAVAGLWLAVSIPVFAQSDADSRRNACQADNLTSTVTVSRIVFRGYRSDSSQYGCLKVFSSDKVVFQRTMDNDGFFTLGQRGDAEEHIPAIADGTDVTGRGRPDMIVSAFTGGTHCCRIHYVFELQPKFRLLATIQDADDAGGISYFARDKEDAHYYFYTGDWTFDYWPSQADVSWNAPIVLRFMEDARGGGFHLAWDRMKTPAPTQAEWNEKLNDAKDAPDPKDVTSPASLWNTVLNLIYTGHSELAWKFVDEMGPKTQQKPFPSLADFCWMLKSSPYWADLRPRLKGTPPACASAGPKKAQWKRGDPGRPAR